MMKEPRRNMQREKSDAMVVASNALYRENNNKKFLVLPFSRRIVTFVQLPKIDHEDISKNKNNMQK